MATNVIKGISCDYTFMGNVSDINREYVLVPDLSDIDSINSKITKLENTIHTLQEKNEKMHDLVEEYISELKSIDQSYIAEIKELMKKYQEATLKLINNSQE